MLFPELAGSAGKAGGLEIGGVRKEWVALERDWSAKNLSSIIAVPEHSTDCRQQSPQFRLRATGRVNASVGRKYDRTDQRENAVFGDHLDPNRRISFEPSIST